MKFHNDAIRDPFVSFVPGPHTSSRAFTQQSVVFCAGKQNVVYFPRYFGKRCPTSNTIQCLSNDDNCFADNCAATKLTIIYSRPIDADYLALKKAKGYIYQHRAMRIPECKMRPLLQGICAMEAVRCDTNLQLDEKCLAN